MPTPIKRIDKGKVYAIADGAVSIDCDPEYPHTFFSAFACDVAGVPLPDYSGVVGAFTVDVKSINCPVWQVPVTSSLSATVPEDGSVTGNLSHVRFTPLAITGATHFRVLMSQNRDS